jgi:DNA polymerase V
LNVFALVDCNNFYASCERIFQPLLADKPIAILSNNDGCVIARSNEAKALGLPMGAPAHKFASFFRQHNVQVFSSNYPLYGDMSQRVMEVLRQFTPEVEVYSIDEAFLHFDGFEDYDMEAYAQQMRKRVHKWTGMPVSIGLGPSKGLAKVANRVAKKFADRTKGVYVIDSDEKRIKALKWLPIADVWGIGRKHAKRLALNGVQTAYDFTQLSDDWVRKHMTVVGLRLKKDLEGTATIPMELEPVPKKAIATTRSFEHLISSYEELSERISTFATLCAEKLRAQGSSCHAVYVFVRSNPFRSDLPQYRNGMLLAMPTASQSSLTISKYALKGLAHIFKSGIEYKKAGVLVTGIVPKATQQLALFGAEDPRHEALMQRIDAVHRKYGPHKIKLANQDLTRTFKMKQAHLSPRYTTDIHDVITVR